MCSCTYDEPRSAHTRSGHAVAVGSVGAGARLPAALAVVTGRTRLVAVQARPSGRTGALPGQRVTAGGAQRTETWL